MNALRKSPAHRALFLVALVEVTGWATYLSMDRPLPLLTIAAVLISMGVFVGILPFVMARVPTQTALKWVFWLSILSLVASLISAAIGQFQAKNLGQVLLSCFLIAFLWWMRKTIVPTTTDSNEA